MTEQADDPYELDIIRARNLLGWEEKYRLLDTLPIIIQKLKENPVKWYKENKLEVPSWLKDEQKEEKKVLLNSSQTL